MLKLFWNWFTNENVVEGSIFLTVDHLIGISMLVVMCLLLYLNINKIKNNPVLNKKIKRIIGFTALTSLIILRIYEINWHSGNVWQAMPLHFCSVAYILLIVAMFTENQKLNSYVFYMGITGGSMAILFPGVSIGISYYRTIEYFFSHALLIFVPIYLFNVDGVRLGNWAYALDYCKFLLITSLLLVVYNDIFGTGYFFLNGRVPNSWDEVLPPWPANYFILLGFACGCGLLLNLVPFFQPEPVTEEATQDVKVEA